MSNQQQISIRSARRDCCLRTRLQDRHSTTHTEHIAINVQNYLHCGPFPGPAECRAAAEGRHGLG